MVFLKVNFYCWKREKCWVVQMEQSKIYKMVLVATRDYQLYALKCIQVVVMLILLLVPLIVATWLLSISERTRINTSHALSYLILLTACWGSNCHVSFWEETAEIQSLAQGHVHMRLWFGPHHLPWSDAQCPGAQFSEVDLGRWVRGYFSKTHTAVK